MTKPKGLKKTKQQAVDQEKLTVPEMRELYNEMQRNFLSDFDHAKTIASAIIEQLIPMDSEDARVLLSETALAYGMVCDIQDNKEGPLFCDMAYEAVEDLQGQLPALLRMKALLAKVTMACSGVELYRQFASVKPQYDKFVDEYDGSIPVVALVQLFMLSIIEAIESIETPTNIKPDDLYAQTIALLQKSQEQTDSVIEATASLRIMRAISRETSDLAEMEQVFEQVKHLKEIKELQPNFLQLCINASQLVEKESPQGLKFIRMAFWLLVELDDVLEEVGMGELRELLEVAKNAKARTSVQRMADDLD